MTKVVDKSPDIFSVIGARVSSPNAMYPAQPKIAIKIERTAKVDVSNEANFSGFWQEAFKLRMRPAPSML